MNNDKILTIYRSSKPKYKNFILKIVALCDLQSAMDSSFQLSEFFKTNNPQYQEDSEFYYDEFLKHQTDFFKLKNKIFKYSQQKLNFNNNETQELINYVQVNFKLCDYPG